MYAELQKKRIWEYLYMLTPKVLTDKYAESVFQLFKEKNWAIESEEAQLSTFDRFCHRMAELGTDEDRDFMLDLSKEYLWVKNEDYERLLINIFRKWFSAIDLKFTQQRRLCICPLLPEEDFGALKSSKYMLYLCQSTALRILPEIHESAISLVENPGMLKHEMEHMQCLILIDDYIGTGETGIGCLDYIRKLGIDFADVYVISLVAQGIGVKALQDKGVKVFSEIVCRRGISDRYPMEQVDARLDRMREIGKKIKIWSNMRLGYGESEALVTMIKTPNNTFPFYWYEKDENTLAPFPRRGNVMMVKGVKDESISRNNGSGSD